jgi:hypothetical protein
MISFTSALDSISWDDKVIFHEDGKKGNYGYYEINDTDFWLFNNKPIKTIELIENDYSVLLAWNIKEIEIFKEAKLFDKTNYLDKSKKKDKSKLIESERHFYREWINKTKIVNNNSCLVFEESNNETFNCLKWINNPYEENYEGWSDWKIYSFQKVGIGLYQTKTLVTRKNQKTGSIDWIDENNGHNLKEWALWWDSNWAKKRSINITETSGNSFTNYSTLLYINYTEDTNSNANANFSDLRFLNSTESGELDYWIENKTDGSFAWIWVEVTTLTASSSTVIYMYYDNEGVSSNSNISAAFIYGNDGTVDDFTDNLIGTCTASLDSGAIKSVCSSWSSSGIQISSLSSGNYSLDYKAKLQNDGSGTHIGGFTMTDTTLANGYDNRVPILLGDNDADSQYWQVWDSTGQILNSPNAHAFGWVELTSEVNLSILSTTNGANAYIVNEGESNYSYSGAGYRGAMNDIGYLSTSQFDSTIWLDNITFREKASSEPTYSIGVEEQDGALVLQISPQDNIQVNETYQTFRCNASFDSNIENLTLILNGVDNYTNSTVGTFIDLNYSINLTTQGIYEWNCRAITSLGNITTTPNRTLIVHPPFPPNVVIHYPGTAIDYHINGNNITLNWTITEIGQNLTTHITNCTYEYNGNITILNNTLCTQINETSFEYVTGVNNLTFNVTDDLNFTNSTLLEWYIKIIKNNNTFNTTTFETAAETFEINLTSNTSLTAIDLDYNGTSYSLSNQGSGIWNSLIDIPLSKLQNNTLKYEFTYSGDTINSDLFYQNVSETVFTYCNASYTDDFLNISFKDESDLSFLNASIPTSAFVYYLGSGLVNKSYTYVNSSLNYNYTFCASTAARNLYVSPILQFKQGTAYPQRIWQPSIQTYNSTVTNQILYLLSSIDGIYVTFQIINPADQVISGVEVKAEREIGGSDVIVGIGTTGASGTVTLWLNPDFTHDFTFTKTGLPTVSESFAPTQSGYTITMAGETATQNSTTRGIEYSILPSNSFLENDTIYLFGFNLTSSFWDVDEYGFDLRLENGTVITGGSTSVEGTQLTKSYNVTNQTLIYLDAYWLIDGNYTNVTRYWSIQNTEYTEYSIAAFFEDLNTYMDSGLFGLDDFGRYLIAFIILFVSVGLMGYKFGISSPLGISTLSFTIVFFLDVVTGILPTIRGIEHLPTFIAGLILALSAINEVRIR